MNLLFFLLVSLQALSLQSIQVSTPEQQNLHLFYEQDLPPSPDSLYLRLELEDIDPDTPQGQQDSLASELSSLASEVFECPVNFEASIYKFEDPYSNRDIYTLALIAQVPKR